MVDIKGLEKARVLKALYDHSHPQGLGFLQAGKTVTLEECAKLLEENTYFDYLGGRVLKVDLSKDELDPRLYDQDCGEGAAQRAVDSIRDEPKGGEDAAGAADGEKKERSLEERREDVKEAVTKITEILAALPPDVSWATAMYLKMYVLDPVLPGYVMPPMGGLTPSQVIGMRAKIHLADELDKRGWPFKGRFG